MTTLGIAAGRAKIQAAYWQQTRRRTAQAGLTLIELMISITLGMFVIAAGLSLLLSTKSTYVVSDDNTRLLDAGRYAIESVTRSVRQASYENLDSDQAPIVNDGTLSPNIDGFDARTYNVGSGTAAVAAVPTAASGNVSDILRLRFFGASTAAGATPMADKTILNCAGVPVEGVTAMSQAEQGRGWSIYFVNRPASGEPELRCGFLDAAGKLDSTAIASGVESFQVLYGVDRDANGIPDQFMTATAIASTANPNELWNRVAAVKISLLIRGNMTEQVTAPNKIYDLFGPAYRNASDLGTQIDEQNTAQVPVAYRSRTRKVFSTLIQLRNAASGGNLVALP